MKRAPFSVHGGELKLEAVRPAYQVLDAFHHGTVDGYSSVSTIIAGEPMQHLIFHATCLVLADHIRTFKKAPLSCTLLCSCMPRLLFSTMLVRRS